MARSGRAKVLLWSGLNKVAATRTILSCSVEPLARQIRPEAERYIAIGYSFFEPRRCVEDRLLRFAAGDAEEDFFQAEFVLP